MRHIPVDDDPCKTVLTYRLVGNTSLSHRRLTVETSHESEYFNYLGRDGRFDLCRKLDDGEIQWIER